MKRVTKRLNTGCCVGLALFFSGCLSFSGKFGTRIPVDRITLIRDGETTREQIASWFGPPSAFYNPTFLDLILQDEEDITGSGAPILNDVYTYRYIENDSTIVFVPIFFTMLRALPVSETLTIFFDEDGRVEYHAYRRDPPAARKAP